MLLSGTTGARWGEHSPAVPGSVLLQEQALRRGVHLRPALLWLQRCKCSRVLPAVVADSVGTHRCFWSLRRLEKRGRLCWGRSRRSEIRWRLRLQICLHRCQTTTRLSGGCPLWTWSPSLHDTHWLAHGLFGNSDVEHLTLDENVPGKELCENKHL